MFPGVPSTRWRASSAGPTSSSSPPNENPLGISPKAAAAIRAHVDRGYQYPEIINPALQAAFAEANGVAPQCIVTGNGADSILYCAALVFLRPGDEVLVPEVTFDLYRTVALTKAATVIEVPMPELELDPAAILERVTARTRMLFVCNPQQPDRGAAVRRRHRTTAGGACRSGWCWCTTRCTASSRMRQCFPTWCRASPAAPAT